MLNQTLLSPEINFFIAPDGALLNDALNVPAPIDMELLPVPQIRDIAPCLCRQNGDDSCNPDTRFYQKGILAYHFINDYYVAEFELTESGYPVEINGKVPMGSVIKAATCDELNAMFNWFNERADSSTPLSECDTSGFIATRLLNDDLVKIFDTDRTRYV